MHQTGALPDRPASFADRGLAVPFTAPAALGARVRAGARGGVEYLLPTTGGRRGLYVLPGPALHAFCGLTLHDTLLDRAITEAVPQTPAAMRALANAVAAGGSAGRAAAISAAARLGRDAAERQAAAATLHALLAPADASARHRAIPPPRQRRAAGDAASGETQERVLADLAGLAALFQGFALGQNPGTGRLDRLADRLITLGRPGATMSAALGARTLAPDSPPPRPVLPVAAVVFGNGARRALRMARARLTDMPALLAAYRRDRESLAAFLGRAEWLLDGWEPICLSLERAAEPVPGMPRRRAAPILHALPVLPVEAESWIGDVASRARRAAQAARAVCLPRPAAGPEPADTPRPSPNPALAPNPSPAPDPGLEEDAVAHHESLLAGAA